MKNKLFLFALPIFVFSVFFLFGSPKDAYAIKGVFEVRVTNYLQGVTANTTVSFSVEDNSFTSCGSDNVCDWTTSSPTSQPLSIPPSQVVSFKSVPVIFNVDKVSYKLKVTRSDGGGDINSSTIDFKASDCSNGVCTKYFNIGQPSTYQCGNGVDEDHDGQYDEHCYPRALSAPRAQMVCLNNTDVRVVLDWNIPLDQDSDPDGYNVYKTDATGKITRKLNTDLITGPNNTDFTWTFLNTTSTYYFVVSAVYLPTGSFPDTYTRFSNLGSFDPIVCGKPTDGTLNETPSCTTQTQVVFQWNQSVTTGLQGYDLEVSTGDWAGNFGRKTITDTNGGNDSFTWSASSTLNSAGTLTTPVPGTTYYWRIRSRFDFGGSLQLTDYTTPRTFTTALCAPTLTLQSNTCVSGSRSVNFTWTNVSGETSYDIRVSQSASFTNTGYKLPLANATSQDWDGAPLWSGTQHIQPLDGITYYARIKAVSGSGTSAIFSAWSNVVTISSQNCTAIVAQVLDPIEFSCATANPFTDIYFTWDDPRALARIQVATNNTFTTGLQNKQVNNAVYTPASGLTLNTGVTYYVRVHDQTNNLFSNIRSFSRNACSGDFSINFAPSCSDTVITGLTADWISPTSPSGTTYWWLEVSPNSDMTGFSYKQIPAGRVSIAFPAGMTPSLTMSPDQSYHVRIVQTTGATPTPPGGIAVGTVQKGPKSIKVPFCTPGTMTRTIPSCTNTGDYSVTFNWVNRGPNWTLQVSPNNFTTIYSADVSGRIYKGAPSNLAPSFNFAAGTTYRWRIVTPYNGTGTEGPSFSVPWCATTGWLDATGNCWATGWAVDPNTSDTSIWVHVYRDGPAGTGTAVGAYKADLESEDVESVMGYTGNHRFAINFTPANTSEVEVIGGNRGLFDGGTHSIYVYGISETGGSNSLLQGAPKNIQCLADLKVELQSTNGQSFDSGATAQFTYRVTNYGKADSPASGYTIGLWPQGVGFALPNCPTPQDPDNAYEVIRPSIQIGGATSYSDYTFSFNVGSTPTTYTAYAIIIPFCGFTESGSASHWNDNYAATTYKVNANTWFESTGGDVGSQSSITISNPTPPRNQSQYLCASVNLGSTTSDDVTCPWEMKNYRSEQMVGCADSVFDTGCVYNYFDYFQKFRQQAIIEASGNPNKASCNLSNGTGDGFYYCAGDMRYQSGGLGVGSSPKGKQIWFIDGNLTIEQNMNLPRAGDVLVFVVAGNISVNSNVSVADGMFVTGGTYYDYTIGGSKATATALTTSGAIYAKNMDLGRYLSATAGCVTNCDNKLYAALIVNYPAAKYVISLRDELGSPSISWNEVAP